MFYFVIHLSFPAKEFKKYHLGLNRKMRISNLVPLQEAKIPDVTLPQEFDWRDYNIVTEVKNQVIYIFCYIPKLAGHQTLENAELSYLW
jgi:C1A family cysteine protease